MQLGIELGHHRAGTDLVEIVVDAHDLGAGRVVAVQVDGDEVAVDGRTVHDVELGVVLAQPVDLALDLLLADGEARQRDLQAVVAGNGDDRTHLDHGVEGDGAAVLAAGDVDVGLRDRVELGVDDGAGVEVGQGLTERLGAQRAGTAHAGLEHLARHLARPEARHADLLGEGAHHVAEGPVEFRLVDLHTQADEVSLHWLGCRTHHEPITLPVAPQPGRTTRPEVDVPVRT